MSFRLLGTAVACTGGACVGGAPHQLLSMRHTAELWIADEISRSVNLCWQGTLIRTNLCDSASYVVLARLVTVITRPLNVSAARASLRALADATPPPVSEICRWETFRHGVGVFLWSITLRLLARCVLLG
jgi:hypothetical protein